MTNAQIIPRSPVRCIDLQTAAQKFGYRVTCDGKVLYLVRKTIALRLVYSRGV